MFKNYVEVRDWLESFIPLVYGKEELGLARIENLLEKLGNPQKNFKSILVGGTAGKGSTAYYIARLLHCVSELVNSVSQYVSKPVNQNISNTGKKLIKESRSTNNTESTDSPTHRLTDSLKVGLHVSPHLIYIGERMQIFERQKIYDGSIPVRRLISLVNEIKPVIDDIKSKQPELLPSYFEILVALSFLYFAKERVDFAVVEVGLGGRLDATNILQPEICVITNVGLDHTEILGDTVERIAWEKAGIIKTSNKQQVTSNKKLYGVPVVTGATGKALKVIEKVVKERNSLLINIYTQYRINDQNSDILRHIARHENLFDTELDGFVYINKKMAIFTVLALGISLTKSDVKKAFSRKFAGRFEEIDPTSSRLRGASRVILDGAHNPDKIKALISFVKQNYQGKNICLVLAFKKGKNWQEMIDLLLVNLPIKKVIATEYKSVADTGLGSAVEPEEIAKYIDYRFKVIDVRVIKNSQEAVFEAINESHWPLGIGRSKNNTNGKSLKPKALVLVTGSLYLVGEVRTLWELPEF